MSLHESFLGYVLFHLKTSTEKLTVAKSDWNELKDPKKLPQNSKEYGQPMRAMMETAMKDHRIDRSAYFGGDIQGKGCLQFCDKRASITSSWKSEVLDLPESQVREAMDDIWQVLDMYEQMTGHFDALFSICRTKRNHLTNSMIESAKVHRDQALALWRLLGLLVTPKLHTIEDHLIDYLIRFGGIGDMGEDEGERCQGTVKVFKVKDEQGGGSL